MSNLKLLRKILQLKTPKIIHFRFMHQAREPHLMPHVLPPCGVYHGNGARRRPECLQRGVGTPLFTPVRTVSVRSTAIRVNANLRKAVGQESSSPRTLFRLPEDSW